MKEKNDLAYFLNSIKETLPFEDEKDFGKKINGDKEFRIRIQKLVFLSKFFGWENNYHFNFHLRGPYSIELSKVYRNLNESLKNASMNPDLRIDSFKEFINGQTNSFLEATSTILYYANKLRLKSVDETKIIRILSYLKPDIPKKIIKEVYKRIKEFGLLNHYLLNQDISFSKEIVLDKLDGLIDIFNNFEVCSNQTLVLGSLDYFRIALKRENLEKSQKEELLTTVYDYGEYVEHYYFTNYTLGDDFSYCDLTPLNEKFDKLQDYISDLKILPRLYDEDVDLNIFNE